MQDREYTVFWAEETVLEQSLFLDILFLLYYEPLLSCKATRLMELLQLFQVNIVGKYYYCTSAERVLDRCLFMRDLQGALIC